MTLVRNDVQATVNNTPINDIDIQEIIVWFEGEKFKFYNVYCPPPSKSKIHFEETRYSKTIIAGDFNANLPSLGYSTYNQRGHDVEDLCNASNLKLMQSKKTPPTLLHRAHGTTSRPDLTMVSADILDKTTIKVLGDLGGSDHKPTLITYAKLCGKAKPMRKKLWNFKKANWKKYQNLTDDTLEKIQKDNQSISIEYKNICKAILDGARKHIPRGFRKKYKPFWNPELEEAVKEKRKCRETAEKTGKRENKTAYNRATAKVQHIVKTSKRNEWRSTCGQLNLIKDGHKAHRLFRNLSGTRKRTNPQPLQQNRKYIANPKKKADIFNKHFASVNKTTRRKTLDRALSKLFKRKRQSPTVNNCPFEQDFNMTELDTAVKKLACRKAPGPDNIKNEMIKNLGPKGKTSLLNLINKTWKESTLPSTWLTATITPILKKGKNPEEPKSYRPISLTSCIGKLAERMVNNRLYWWLEEGKILDNSQAGFRRGCRTEDQLFRLTQNTIDGFQEKKDTTAVFIDLQQAYDRIWRKGLLIKMQRLGISGRMLDWIQAFLTNRTIRTRIDGTLSSKKTLEEGLPQGSALSCTLFLIFLNDLPANLDVSLALFADDLAIWVTGKYPILARAKLNRALSVIGAYCNFWKLKLNESKTVYSIFTRSTKASRKILQLRINGRSIEKEENPVYLGVKLDRTMMFKEHMNDLKEAAIKRLTLVKRLAGTTWGADKRTLRQLYIGYVRAKMDYCLPLQTVSCKTATDAVDRVQNQALRLICGGMRSTPTAACQIDANVEPLDLRRNKSLLEAIERYRRADQGHPNRKLVENWKQNNRLQQESPLDISTKLTQHSHLPTDRENEVKCPGPPPWKPIYTAEIKTSLLDETANKNTAPHILTTCAYETIENYPKTIIHAFTDGSAFKATTFAGFGVFLKYPDKTSFDWSEPCGNTCSNYIAEIKAITTAIEIIHQQFETEEKNPSDVVIFSDSKSALQAMENIYDNREKEIKVLATAINNLHQSFKTKVTLQWIPGHSNVAGNERADHLAKEGAKGMQPNRPVNQETVKQILKNNTKEEWLNRWTTGMTGRVMYSEMNKPKPNDTINTLCRADQCTIFQLRTGHGKLNHYWNRLDASCPPLCRNCPYPYETTKHMLLECPGLVEARKKTPANTTHHPKHLVWNKDPTFEYL
jgi:ribonuclease HI